MKSITTSHKGFTLMEMMVAMAIASIVMAGIYTFYRSQLRTHVTQQALVDMQQDARIAMYMMTREIRMAGYDPQNSAGAALLTADAAEIEFNSDIDGGGDIDDQSERFYYALSNDADRDGKADGTPCNLERGSWDAGGNLVLAPLALNIDALNFVYLDSDGDRTTTLADIRSVQISLVARSGDQVPVLMHRQTDSRTYTNQLDPPASIFDAPNDNFRRIQLSATVKVRNMGL
jgi:type IV pilus assembly protein PilW